MIDDTFGPRADPKRVIFSQAFRTTVRNVRADIGVSRAAYTKEYLEALVSRDSDIASFTVAEIIEHLSLFL